MRRFVLFAICVVVAVAAATPFTAAAAGRGLRILYVGPDPAAEPETPWYLKGRTNDDRWAELIVERMPAFEKLLKGHFDAVKTLPVSEYKASMSDDFDVTIMDALPEPIETKKDENGREKRFRLPADFDRPMITTSDVGPTILGRDAYGWKIEHLCQCLFDHAHGSDSTHPIFNTPHAVKPTMTDVAVPASFRFHASSRDLGKTMPMWRVSTEEFGKTLIGCVSFPQLDDSPDGEVIAGGECMKGADSVAIGRQGNFLHWGFAASPTYMTNEAKLAFINAIHYISQFAGQRPLVHRVPGNITRTDIDDTLFLLSDDGLAAINASIDEMNARMKKGIDELKAKQERGEKLTEREAEDVKRDLIPPYTRQMVIEYSVPQEIRAIYGDEWTEYEKYYAGNRDYLYPDFGDEFFKPLIVDDDAKALGIANNDVRLLEKCVELLESGEQAEMAQEMLLRYTNETFESAEQWRKWLNEHRDRLFFTESGGFKFMVAPPDLIRGAGKANYESPAASSELSTSSIPDASGGPVKWSVEVKPRAVKRGEEATIVVNAKIARGWHIYDRQDAGSPFTPTTLLVEDAAGERIKVEWDRPAATIDPRTQSRIFDGNISFTGRVDITGAVPGKQLLTLVAHFQACNDRECERPSEQEVPISLQIE